ncbi:MAG TPA: nucleotidyltransferase domain-containing protein [Bacteroidales bacterium]|jgi:predicted nucleotidyltransferase|nr:nucleotidyltransferase domain-containing protein [Bacteroidales bacterium]
MFGLSDEVIADLCAVFRQYPNVQEVLIFGSRAKGDYRNGSDIDLAIKGDNTTFGDLMDISCDIDDLGLLYKVDLLLYAQEKETPVGQQIDATGKLFYRKGYY